MTESAAANPKAGAAPDPSHQHAAQRRSAGKGDGARQFDPRIGRGQAIAAIPATAPMRAPPRYRRPCRIPRQSRADASRGSVSRSSPISARIASSAAARKRFRARHQPPPRDAVGEQARGDREQDERQRQRGLQQAGLAFADAEQQHRDDRGRGQRDLLGRLRRQIGPGQAVEGRGQAEAWLMRGHGWIPCICRSAGIVWPSRTAKPPASRQVRRIRARCSCK